MTDGFDLLEVLKHIDPAVLDYQSWINVGMALKEEGYTAADWERWSMSDSARFRSGECFRKWRSFQGAASPCFRTGLLRKFVKFGKVFVICVAEHFREHFERFRDLHRFNGCEVFCFDKSSYRFGSLGIDIVNFSKRCEKFAVTEFDSEIHSEKSLHAFCRKFEYFNICFDCVFGIGSYKFSAALG